MKAFFFSMFCYLSVLLLVLLPNPSESATVVVDGTVSSWNNPTVNIGDSIIFKHKFHYSLYIFRSRLAFKLCNFTQATLLTSPNSSSYTWRPSRLGDFFFSFNNGTSKPCQQGEKLAVKVIPQTTTTPSFVTPPAPEPSIEPPHSPPGGIAASSPAYPWPFQPHEQPAGPGGAPGPAATAPLEATGKGGTFPFIGSNPAVPLPTDEVDSATTSPLPTLASNHSIRKGHLVGLLGLLILPCLPVFLMM